MITVYGLKNCDTCRKALKWLDAQGMDHQFHDLRKDGLDPARLKRWIAAASWETVLNRRGTTWRGLGGTEKEGMNETKAAALMAAHPALIKRPVFEKGARIIVGFKDDQRRELMDG